MGATASQNTILSIVYSTVYSGADQTKHQRSALLAFVRGIYRRPENDETYYDSSNKLSNWRVEYVFNVII